jgi:endogenous inhibitor of DNA gyrase (YacG/DUF329 family)
MNNEQRECALSLRKQGLSNAAIAKQMSLSANTVKSFCRRHAAKKLLCRNCGKPLTQAPKQKPRSFCSGGCRSRWWGAHRDQVKKKAFYRIVCACCGKEFDSYGNKNRKYCCHPCYIRDRFNPP